MYIEICVSEEYNKGRSELDLICHAMGGLSDEHQRAIAQSYLDMGKVNDFKALDDCREKIKVLHHEGRALAKILATILNTDPRKSVYLKMSYQGIKDGGRSELQLICEAMRAFTATQRELSVQYTQDLSQIMGGGVSDELREKIEIHLEEGKTLNRILDKIMNA